MVMKKIWSINNSPGSTGLALLVIRVGIAALMLTHGLPKLVTLLSGEPVQFPQIMGMSAALSLVLTVFTEVVCSILLLVGFATRLSALFLAITMMVAAFVYHAADPFAAREPALQYLLAYLVLIIAGSGKYSVDYLIQQKQNTHIQGKQVRHLSAGVS